MDGNRRSPTVELPPAITADVRSGLLKPPEDLLPDEQVCWRKWAPRALKRDALTPETEPGFRTLCERMAQTQRFKARLALIGPATHDGLDIAKELRNWLKDLNTSLKDFRLTGFGKPETSGKPKPVSNPWANIAQGMK